MSARVSLTSPDLAVCLRLPGYILLQSLDIFFRGGCWLFGCGAGGCHGLAGVLDNRLCIVRLLALNLAAILCSKNTLASLESCLLFQAPEFTESRDSAGRYPEGCV